MSRRSSSAIHDSHWRPLADAPAKSRGEQRTQQTQRAAAGGLHDSGPHVDHPQSGFGGRLRGGLPVRDDVGEEAVAAHTFLAQHGVTAVVPVDTDRRGADERPVEATVGSDLGQAAGGPDPAVADAPSCARR